MSPVLARPAAPVIPRGARALPSAVPSALPAAVPLREADKARPAVPAPPAVVVVCFEPPDSFIGRHAARMAAALADAGAPVHLVTRQAPEEPTPRLTAHAVGGEGSEEDLPAAVEEFTRRAVNAVLRLLPPSAEGVTLLGCEWSSVPALSLLHALRNYPMTVSFHSLEGERSDMTSDVSRHIAAVEAAGLREAGTILLHRPATAALVHGRFPDCAGRIVESRQFFHRDVPWE